MGASGSAQTYDKRTVFTFSGPVALPGVTLPPGQYVFRLADPAGSRKVVQVLSADGKTPYGMFFSLPAERFGPASTPEVQFMEGQGTSLPSSPPKDRNVSRLSRSRQSRRPATHGRRPPRLHRGAHSTSASLPL